jgi:hypothetical protein
MRVIRRTEHANYGYALRDRESIGFGWYGGAYVQVFDELGHPSSDWAFRVFDDRVYSALDASRLGNCSSSKNGSGVVTVTELHRLVIDNKQPAAHDEGRIWWDVESFGNLYRCRHFLDTEKPLSCLLPLGGGFCVKVARATVSPCAIVRARVKHLDVRSWSDECPTSLLR